MGESAAKFRPEVDLDEFERRLRAAAPAAPQQNAGAPADPLAELARLVGGDASNKRQDPFEALFRAQHAIHDVREATVIRDDYPQQDIGRSAGRAAPQAGYDNRSPSYPQDAYAAQAAQQAGYAEHDPRWAPESSSQAYGAEQGWPAAFTEAAPPPAPRLRRKVMTAMAAVLALGVAGLAGALALRGKSTGGEVVTIQADPDPAKVKPPQGDAAAAPAGQALFDRKGGQEVAKVVANAEQPADLAVKIKNAPVAAPPPPAAAPAASDSVFPAPKRVKTVSVRADGSVVGQAPAAPPPRSSLPSMAANMPAGVTPTASAPAGKTAERAAPVAVAKPTAAVKPTQVANTPAKPAAEPAGAGGFAVQLAGTPSESEASAAATRLTAKYASALGGHKASFVSADVNGKTVYRVRVGKLSEDGAKNICAAIKGQGGACFVTKN